MTRREFLRAACERGGEDPEKHIQAFTKNVVEAGFPPERFNQWLDGEMLAKDMVALLQRLVATPEEVKAAQEQFSKEQWAKRESN